MIPKYTWILVVLTFTFLFSRHRKDDSVITASAAKQKSQPPFGCVKTLWHEILREKNSNCLLSNGSWIYSHQDRVSGCLAATHRVEPKSDPTGDSNWPTFNPPKNGGHLSNHLWVSEWKGHVNSLTHSPSQKGHHKKHAENIKVPGSSKGYWIDDKGCPYTIP